MALTTYNLLLLAGTIDVRGAATGFKFKRFNCNISNDEKPALLLLLQQPGSGKIYSWVENYEKRKTRAGTKISLEIRLRDDNHVLSHQCDQIWRNSTTLAKF